MAKKSPKPPKLKAPQPSPEEIALQKAQSGLISQLTGQSNIAFGQAQEDRGLSDFYLDKLSSGKGNELSDTERSLADQLAALYYDTGMKGVTTGANKAIFDRNQRDTLGALSSAGVLNSSTSTALLGDLQKALLSQIGDVSNQAGLQKINLLKDFMDKKLGMNMDLFQTLRGGAAQGTNLSANLANSALSGSQNLGAQYRQQRMDAFNVDASNQQAEYQWALGNYNNRKSARAGLGGVLGNLAGAAIGFGMGGGLLGAGLGGALGGGLGTSLGGFF